MADTDRRANFVRLAEGRTQSALEAIRKIGNLSNKRAYDYGEADVRKIVKALRDSTADLEKKFGSNPEAVDSFRL